jgi:hypothetical protein
MMLLGTSVSVLREETLNMTYASSYGKRRSFQLENEIGIGADLFSGIAQG